MLVLWSPGKSAGHLKVVLVDPSFADSIIIIFAGASSLAASKSKSESTGVGSVMVGKEVGGYEEFGYM